MSQPQYGTNMDRPLGAGSVKRARERAMAAAASNQDARSQLPSMRVQPPDSSPDTSPRRAPPPGPSRIPRLQGSGGSPGREGREGGGVTGPISRPTPMPQWPLPGPIPSPVNSPGSEPYRPPPGRSQPPQRPPRPSQVPSILDASRLQDHTPTFQYQPQPDPDPRYSQDAPGSVPLTPSSRQTVSSISSVGSIPDFPMPSAMPPAPPQPLLAPPRRSVNLGPPPSARRGASSFYSNASLVSPIPEESPRSRSHGSYASSAAMPESWGTASPPFSPDPEDERYFDDMMAEEESFRSQSHDGDDGDESKLVRSASIGKRGKPAIVMNRGASSEQVAQANRSEQQAMRPSPSPVQNREDVYMAGNGFMEVSSASSGTLPMAKGTGKAPAPTADAMLGAFAAASGGVDIPRPMPAQQPYSRLSAIRRPPKLGLDIDAVRDMEARGSMTSLPDLIKRATRLAAMMDRGKRPASRFDNVDWPDEKGYEKELSMEDPHQSGLSDMLAAFPPPAAATPAQGRARGSWFRRSTSSWPLAPAGAEELRARDAPRELMRNDDDSNATTRKNGRRCCGLPLWAFIVIAVLVILIVAAAIAVPLYFFVFRDNNRNNNNAPEPVLTDCQTQLRCQNGGTNVVARGVCSCICTNGFTGSTCAVSGATGCTTTNLVLMSDEGNITNVTLGQAIPRLVQQAQTNFTVPLMGTTILSKFNQASLSCIAQNSLVTFDGRSTRMGVSTAEVVMDDDSSGDEVDLNPVFAVIPTITVPALKVMTTLVGTVTITTTITSFPPTVPTLITPVVPTPTSSIVPPPAPTATFTVTEEVLDFSRVTVLFILQERDLSTATSAQSTLQKFFVQASRGSGGNGSGVTIDMATSLLVADGITVDLVHLLINFSGAVSGRSTERWLELEGS
ncbi:hypothetical protein F5X68DRAFT_4497 [Plectosphaerella plurivora]|uniref:EGF-like domain-containing protein n=1 Tax=Plectosphaerella plurivora TaxID=936078 RepID=A0A9P8VLH0_9PEZI|nr:hypothetical protein F5X68DRAFT_4497 [Plectosphaerella plurivora]